MSWRRRRPFVSPKRDTGIPFSTRPRFAFHGRKDAHLRSDTLGFNGNRVAAGWTHPPFTLNAAIVQAR
jgi:hypothetical protein